MKKRLFNREMIIRVLYIIAASIYMVIGKNDILKVSVRISILTILVTVLYDLIIYFLSRPFTIKIMLTNTVTDKITHLDNKHDDLRNKINVKVSVKYLNSNWIHFLKWITKDVFLTIVIDANPFIAQVEGPGTYDELKHGFEIGLNNELSNLLNNENSSSKSYQFVLKVERDKSELVEGKYSRELCGFLALKDKSKRNNFRYKMKRFIINTLTVIDVNRHEIYYFYEGGIYE